MTGDSGLALRLEYLGLDQLLERHLRPIAQDVLVNELKLQKKDADFAMLIKSMRYRADQIERKNWPKHCDGDLATLNICLGNEFEGGALQVWRDENNADLFEHKEVGSCIFHDGKLMHEVMPVTKGCRITLIVKLFKPRE